MEGNIGFSSCSFTAVGEARINIGCSGLLQLVATVKATQLIAIGLIMVPLLVISSSPIVMIAVSETPAEATTSVPETHVGQCGIYICIRYRFAVGSLQATPSHIIGYVLSSNGMLFSEKILIASIGPSKILVDNSTIIVDGANYTYKVLNDAIITNRIVAASLSRLLGSIGYFIPWNSGGNVSDSYKLYNIRITGYTARIANIDEVNASLIEVAGYGRVLVAGVIGESLKALGVDPQAITKYLTILDSVATPSSSIVVAVMAARDKQYAIYVEAVYAYPPGLGDIVLNLFAEASQGVVTGSAPSYSIVVLYPELRGILELLASKGIDSREGLNGLDAGFLPQFLAWRDSICRRLHMIDDPLAYSAALTACLVEPLDPYATIFILDYGSYVRDYLRRLPDAIALSMIPDLVRVLRNLDSGYGVLVVFKPSKPLEIETVEQRVVAYIIAHGAVLLAPLNYMEYDPPILIVGLEPRPEAMLTRQAYLFYKALLEQALSEIKVSSGVDEPADLVKTITSSGGNIQSLLEEDERPPGSRPIVVPALEEPDEMPVEGLRSVEESWLLPSYGSRGFIVYELPSMDWMSGLDDLERARRIMEALRELEETIRGKSIEVPSSWGTNAAIAQPSSIAFNPAAVAGATGLIIAGLVRRRLIGLARVVYGVVMASLSGGDPARCYRATLHILDGIGYGRLSWEGPLEHHERLPPRIRRHMRVVVEAYVAQRYGGRGGRVECNTAVWRILMSIVGGG